MREKIGTKWLQHSYLNSWSNGRFVNTCEFDKITHVVSTFIAWNWLKLIELVHLKCMAWYGLKRYSTITYLPWSMTNANHKINNLIESTCIDMSKYNPPKGSMARFLFQKYCQLISLINRFKTRTSQVLSITIGTFSPNNSLLYARLFIYLIHCYETIQ